MYVITGVGGYVGNRVAELLAERVGAASLIVTSRNEQALAAWCARGATARAADFASPGGLEEAFAGGTKLLLVSTLEVGPNRREQHANAIAAAERAGVQHIVYTSYLGAGDPANTALVTEDHRYTEDLIRDSGLHWNFLRNSQYADAMAEQQAAIAVLSGKSIANTGAGRIAFVSRDDVAAVAVACLTGTAVIDTAYDVTGPEALDYDDIGRMISEISGVPIEVVDLTDEEMYAYWDSQGVARSATDITDASPVPWCSDDMVSFGNAIRNGFMDARTDVVEQLTGRPPEPMRSVMERSAGAWPVPAGGRA